jgi:hypothetical protein
MDTFPLNLAERLSNRFISSVYSSTEIDDGRMCQLRAAIVIATSTVRRNRNVLGWAQTPAVKEDNTLDQYLGLPLAGVLPFVPTQNEYLILQAELARQNLALVSHNKKAEFELVSREKWIRETRKKRAKALRAKKYETESEEEEEEEQPKKKKQQPKKKAAAASDTDKPSEELDAKRQARLIKKRAQEKLRRETKRAEKLAEGRTPPSSA